MVADWCLGLDEYSLPIWFGAVPPVQEADCTVDEQIGRQEGEDGLRDQGLEVD